MFKQTPSASLAEFSDSSSANVFHLPSGPLVVSLCLSTRSVRLSVCLDGCVFVCVLVCVVRFSTNFYRFLTVEVLKDLFARGSRLMNGLPLMVGLSLVASLTHCNSSHSFMWLIVVVFRSLGSSITLPTLGLND